MQTSAGRRARASRKTYTAVVAKMKDVYAQN